VSFDVDPAFRQSGRKSRQRAVRRQVARILAFGGGGLAAVLAVAGLAWLIWPSGEGGGDDKGGLAEATGADGIADEGFRLTQIETSPDDGIVAAMTPFLDLKRAPMILRFEKSESSVARTLPAPAALPVARVGPPGPGQLMLLTDELVLQEMRFVATIPSSSDDLALFQAQRSRGIAELVEASRPGAPAAEAGAGNLVSIDGDEGSWGELVDTGGEATADQAVYVETQIENTTSTVFAVRESERLPLYEDAIVVISAERTLLDVLVSNGLPEVGAQLIVQGAARQLGQGERLAPGSVVALRLRPDVSGPQLLQMSLYSPEAYVGTLAQVGAGRFEVGADPWIADDLLNRTDAMRDQAIATGDVRLLDALYSAAIRNGLSTTLVGELIVMMSQLHDLDRFAVAGDKVTILVASEPGPEGAGPGQILFAGIDGPSGQMPCYVAAAAGAGFSCYDFARGGSGSGGQLGAGLVVPTSGTLTSGFGPRMHPILRQLRNHNGVDWAAPIGTPVQAAAAGRVSLAGDGGGYGNVVYIDHPGGMQTRYAHLNAFAPAGRAGAEVQAGEVIGFVGTTGRSTGPHLHFEVWMNGSPVDPLSMGGGGGGGGGGGTGDGAVDALVAQIIRVESAGRADARNPLSTATGLGQFIESTWLRMMQTYRPDLVQTMGRDQLLALRTNPELSTEMVRHLARESEAYLRARGHEITAGRLYLAHFLGPGGADAALKARPEQTVLEVMGAAVVGANPFLRGKTIADLRDWADRKMQGSGGGGPAVVRAAAVPPEIRAFREAIDEVLAQAG
jgi:murein DD-endopeptidase MepM/ murein hydrolase activator NlpD